MTVSKSAADKAGDRLRSLYDRGRVEAEDIAAYRVLGEWKAQHASTLVKTAMGLRSAVASAAGLQPNGRVVSRLKKEEQILKKLWRGDTKRLSTMQDIAGCRAVVDDLDQAYRVAERIAGPAARKLEQQRLVDMVRSPSDLGYRALHIHAVRDGHRVEVQIRTVRNHDWAMRVERYDEMTGQDAKHGRADREALESLRELSQLLAERDQLDWGQIELPLEGL